MLKTDGLSSYDQNLRRCAVEAEFLSFDRMLSGAVSDAWGHLSTSKLPIQPGLALYQSGAGRRELLCALTINHALHDLHFKDCLQYDEVEGGGKCLCNVASFLPPPGSGMKGQQRTYAHPAPA